MPPAAADNAAGQVATSTSECDVLLNESLQLLQHALERGSVMVDAAEKFVIEEEDFNAVIEAISVWCDVKLMQVNAYKNFITTTDLPQRMDILTSTRFEELTVQALKVDEDMRTVCGLFIPRGRGTFTERSQIIDMFEDTNLKSIEILQSADSVIVSNAQARQPGSPV